MTDPINPVATSLAVLNWLKGLPETIKAWRQFRRRYPRISIVPRHTMYHEVAQPDGTIVTQIVLDCVITNGLEDRSLLIVRAECHVWRRGTVQGLSTLERIQPRHSAEGRFMFHFPSALNKPRHCTLILFDQWEHKKKKWIRLHQGMPYDPF
jgi:hypothetical protein